MDYISGKPVLCKDGLWHIEWTHKNGEKTITAWGVRTFEHASFCVKQIILAIQQ